MSEKMNPNMEKIFFRFIMENPLEFERVEPYFFKNDDIQFIYTLIREEFLISKNKQVPTPQQILAMVKLQQDEHKIETDFLKVLLKGDTNNYEKEWLDPRFRAWKKSNLLKNNMMKSIEFLRGLDEIDYEQVSTVTGKISQLVNEIGMIEEIEDNMGLDFDEPEDHLQNIAVNKIPSGWSSMDTVLNGGWDTASLVCIVGQTNVGKSMWLNNIAVKMADEGKNIVYVSFEMADYKCMKRMGSMRLKIPIDEYNEKSKDSIYIKNKINELKHSNGGLLNNQIGKIFVKKFPTGAGTLTDLDLYLTKLQQVKKIKIDAICVDYINIMGLERGLEFNSSMLYLKGKHLAEGLRYIADKYNIVVITATQTGKDVWDANDINLRDIPESKAVAETCDVVFGIIRNPDMRKNNKYRLKLLKLRDGDFILNEIRFDFNPKFLLMENDEFVNN